MDSISKF